MSQQQALINFTVHLADDALILGHRNSEWTGHGPILEQDIAISNIALDLIGRARNFYQYAARLINQSGQGTENGHDRMIGQNGGIGQNGQQGPASFNDFPDAGDTTLRTEVTEDALAYLRDGWDFKNCLLVEQSNGDWARTILRQFFVSAHQFYLYERLQYSKDRDLAAISEKAYKEVVYHLRWSSEWVIRLGDGTAESHSRMEKALEDLWKFTGELFIPTAYEQQLAAEGIGVDLSLLQLKWEEKVREIFAEATLSYPGAAAGKKGGMLSGGKEGRHTEQLGYILTEMQFLQRAYPGCEW
jgi:ring-1,2-phenylacetyl-CoA epoxidase subunit PaaC